MRNKLISTLLSEIPTGGKAVIDSLFEGKVVNRRLTSLGFTPGTHVEIVQNFGHGPMIVNVRGMRIALGRGEAAKINVQKSDPKE